MPQELCWLSTDEIRFHPCQQSSLAPNQVRIQTHTTRVRHGCDLKTPKQNHPLPYAIPCWGVGKIIETGLAVKALSCGDIVYGAMHHADIQAVSAEQVYPMKNFANRNEFATFIDAGMWALQAIHASLLRFGDRIAIWGMGTVGLMALQFAYYSGAREIIAIDPVAKRLDVAQNLGAHRYLSPGDSLEEPVDIAIDFSGSSLALHEAIASLRKNNTLVAAASAYDQSSLDSTQETCSENHISFCRLQRHTNDPDLQRRVEYSIVTKRVVVWPIISHQIPVDEFLNRLPSVLSDTGEYIQVLLTYPV